MGRRETAERQGRIELELTEERAATLRRISQTLESLIEQLHALRARIGEVRWASKSPSCQLSVVSRQSSVVSCQLLVVSRQSSVVNFQLSLKNI